MRYLYLAIGAAILAVIAVKTDLAGAWSLSIRIGWGFAVVLAIFLADFIVLSLAWRLTLTSVPQSWVWAYRLWKVRMVGEAFNLATPLAQMGGEPVKALILKKQYGVGYIDGVASLVTARTTIVIALVVFLAGGFALMLLSPAVTPAFRATAGTGLGIFSAAILGFFLVQRFKLFSRAGGLLGGGAIGGFLAQIHATEDKLIEFYSGHRARFAGAFLLALVHWAAGAVSLYVIFAYLGRPVTLSDALIIEAFTQLVLATTFFIPANIGTQEGAFLVIITAITGDPALGLAVALIRRGRDIIWVLWGLALGWRYLAQRSTLEAEIEELAPGAPDQGQ